MQFWVAEGYKKGLYHIGTNHLSNLSRFFTVCLAQEHPNPNCSFYSGATTLTIDMELLFQSCMPFQRAQFSFDCTGKEQGTYFTDQRESVQVLLLFPCTLVGDCFFIKQRKDNLLHRFFICVKLDILLSLNRFSLYGDNGIDGADLQKITQFIQLVYGTV